MKNKLLNDLARNYVGDGKNPNLFFVSNDEGVVTVTSDFNVAYNQWIQLSSSLFNLKESMLEDRKWGIICDVSPDSENGKELFINDDSRRFRKEYKKWL